MSQQRPEAVRVAEREAALGDQAADGRLPWLRCRSGQCCAHRTAVATRDDLARKALIDARNLLENHPPIRGGGLDHVDACGACDYPLSGGRADLPAHGDWVSPSYSRNAGRRCPYVQTMDALRRAIAAFEEDDL